MYDQIKKTKESKNRAIEDSVTQTKSNRSKGFDFVDNRLEAVAQRELQNIENNSLQNKPDFKGVVQLNKSQKKRAAKKRAIREYQENQTRIASERIERRQLMRRQKAIAKFSTSDQPARDQILRDHYKIESNLTQQGEINRRRSQATEFGFNKTKENLPGSNLKMDGWHGQKDEIIGGHHKLPKRTLGFLYDRMSELQRTEMRKQLHLDSSAGHKSLARLRSNIIPRGKDKVAPEMRGDDADHAGDVREDSIVDEQHAEGVDTVTNTSGSMTPRSRTYVSLAAHAKEIQKKLLGLAGDKMSDEDAAVATSHLRRAEVLHHKMEGGLGAADYGGGFWEKTKNGKYVKGRARSRNPRIRQGDEVAFDRANLDRKAAEKKVADRAAKEKREVEEKQKAEEKDKEFNARHAGHFIGKSGRFW